MRLSYFTLDRHFNQLTLNNFHPQDEGSIFARWFGPRRAAGRLARDATTIIDTARAVSSSERVRGIALRIRGDLEVAHARGGGDPSRYVPLIDHFRTQHREARQRRDDGALTALTLVIIYLRAERLGAHAAPAREHIDNFISEWTQV